MKLSLLIGLLAALFIACGKDSQQISDADQKKVLQAVVMQQAAENQYQAAMLSPQMQQITSARATANEALVRLRDDMQKKYKAKPECQFSVERDPAASNAITWDCKAPADPKSAAPAKK